MPTIKTTIEPVRDANGKLRGYYTHEDYVGKPSAPAPPRKALRTTTKATAPARQPVTSAGVAFYAPRLGRVITNTHCLKCEHTHQACQCWPPCSYSPSQLAAAAAKADAPLVRENTFQAAVRLRQERGLMPGGTPTPQPAKTGAGVPRLETFAEVVRLRKERGLM